MPKIVETKAEVTAQRDEFKSRLENALGWNQHVLSNHSPWLAKELREIIQDEHEPMGFRNREEDE